MAFRFKLEQVLRYRENLEEQAQLNLVREQRQLDSFKKQLAGLEAELARLLEGFEARKAAGSLSVGEFAFGMEGIRFKERQIEGQQQAVSRQQRVVEKARFALFERVKARKVIDKLREKQQRDYLKESLHQEQKEADEKASIRHGRRVQQR